MELSDLTHALNREQHNAVTASLGHLLILAGAGSGKTKVLVHRIAWLIQAMQVTPYQILAVTFTNKAAGEMRTRLATLLDTNVSHMWVGTFHGLAHRMLRIHWQEAGLPEGFQIIDSDDQVRIIRRVLKALNIDEKQWPPKKIQFFINEKKDQGLRPHHIDHKEQRHLQTMIRFYEAYEESCQRSGVIDFSEILLRTQELFLKNQAILSHYQNRFRQILVDEFQDTNTMQYAWIKLLAQEGSHVMIVGDDDQSIYGWRGAKIENILRFNKDFLGTTTIRLEQNYRSTANILKAANVLIDLNKGRMGKNLWTSGDAGAPIALYIAFNEVDEARYIVSRIVNWCAQGGSSKDVAILYRSNAQSRVLEEALMKEGLPYRVYGGMRFFERAEIKDVLAYLRLIANRDDDSAFERIINLPLRGIGERTLDELRSLARASEKSLWYAASLTIQNDLMPQRPKEALRSFIELINTLAETSLDYALDKQTEYVMQQSGLWKHYSESKEEKAEMRIDNMKELVSAAKQFKIDGGTTEPLALLSLFLSHAALESGDPEAALKNPQACVQLMTLHSAKGLEFPLVFLSGLEEGVFPSKLALEERAGLEEERRLCYVGMTRAMRELVLSYAETRRQYGREEYHRPSQFIAELPQDVIESVRPQTKVKPVAWMNRASFPMHYHVQNTAPETLLAFQRGQKVSHPTFGEGVVLHCEEGARDACVEVKFNQCGVKRLLVTQAHLQSLESHA